ncbi:hypothetical protein [Brevundimonas sp.]|uniref:hypothetical protein n=1 Tax=Brevundimonas sp. TaxID=1871086 RepID=UPI0025B8D494|nr:hypothetical protein [Brevundimonas sp.]
MPSAKPKRPLTGVAAFGLVFGLSILVGVFAGVGSVFAGEVPGAPGLAASLAVNGAAMAAALFLCVWWWRRIDEAAREAHKWAWWWGGCSGALVGGALLLTALHRDGDLGLGAMAPNDVLVAGMSLMFTCQVVGYCIAWAVWWAKRR